MTGYGKTRFPAPRNMQTCGSEPSCTSPVMWISRSSRPAWMELVESKGQACPLPEPGPPPCACPPAGWPPSIPGEIGHLRLPGPVAGTFQRRGVTDLEMLRFQVSDPPQIVALLEDQDGRTGEGLALLDRSTGQSLQPQTFGSGVVRCISCMASCSRGFWDQRRHKVGASTRRCRAKPFP